MCGGRSKVLRQRMSAAAARKRRRLVGPTAAGAPAGVTYADVYNAAYYSSATVETLDAWLLRGLTEYHTTTTWPQKLRWCRHAFTLVRTQSLGDRVSRRTREFMRRFADVLTASARRFLVTLQRALLRYLWRPDGALAQREAVKAVGVLEEGGRQ